MNELKIKGNWNIIKGKLKQAYGELTDSDLTYVQGKEDELVGKIQSRLGGTTDEIHKMLNKYSQP